MIIPSSEKEFTPHPPYIGPAVCVDITTPKLMPNPYGDGTPKPKFKFVFETTLLDEKEKPRCVWSMGFTPSTHEKAGLRKFLRTWQGRDFTAAELKQFDTESFLGRTGTIVIVHAPPVEDGTIYANIASLSPLVTGTIAPSGKFVRQKDRPITYNSAQSEPRTPAATVALEYGKTVIHVGRHTNQELRVIPEESVLNLITVWLPNALANPKQSADDRRLIAALAWWQAKKQAEEATAAATLLGEEMRY